MNRHIPRSLLAGLTLALLALVVTTAQADLSFDERLTDKSPISKEIRPGCYYALYQVRLEAGAKLRFELKSKEFDAYLILLDEQNKVLATDDDSAGGTNARIEFTPTEEKWYRLVVTTAKLGKNGSFSLTIRDADDHDD